MDVTNTTCTLFWKKPIASDEVVKYNITPEDSENIFMSYSLFSAFPEVMFVLRELEPNTTYVLSVYISKIRKTLTTNCTTTTTVEFGMEKITFVFFLLLLRNVFISSFFLDNNFFNLQMNLMRTQYTRYHNEYVYT